MQKNFLKVYLIIFGLILLILNQSSSTNEKIRDHSLSFLIPIKSSFLWLKERFSPFSVDESEQNLKEEIHRLTLEKYLLQKEIKEIQALNEQVFQTFPLQESEYLSENSAIFEHIQTQWKWLKEAIPAQVIFRSFDRWNQSIWIDVGEKTNAQFDKPIVAKNSPVVLGNAIVGVIDFVGQTQSHIRLLTDAKLHPSVRALRGLDQDVLVYNYAERLHKLLQRKKNPFLSTQEQLNFLNALDQLKQTLQFAKKSFYLAKGELQGSLTLLKKGEEPYLKGIGFNYDFADEHGEPRDLRTGKIAGNDNLSSFPIIKVNDILVTTGMDGIFPADLHVALVTKIELLKEGDYFYTIEAQPLVSSLENLTAVFVLPPISVEESLFKKTL